MKDITPTAYLFAKTFYFLQRSMPAHTTLKGLVRTYFREAFNVNRFELSLCELQLCPGRTAALPVTTEASLMRSASNKA